MNSRKTFQIKLKDEVVIEKVDQNIILFYPDKNCIINLNRAASRICELIKNKIDFDFLVDLYYEQLQEIGRPSKDVIKNDILNILDKLKEKEMILIFK